MSLKTQLKSLVISCDSAFEGKVKAGIKDLSNAACVEISDIKFEVSSDSQDLAVAVEV